jgi:predicted nucleic acid-binding protein
LIRVSLDANVIIAASKSSSGESRAIIRLARRRQDITLLATPLAWDEAERTVQRDYPDALDQCHALTQDIEICIEPSVWQVAHVKALLPREKQLPRKDLPILAGAISAAAHLLLTHDGEHFGPLYGTKVEGVEILTPIAGLRRLDPRP